MKNYTKNIMKSRYLNLGCGDRFFKDWINVDYVSSDKNVISHNLLKPFPFNDNSFDVVYSSHVLEHFSYKDAIIFMKECYRVLDKDGIIRIIVPDMELIARSYLNSLNNVLALPNLENKFIYQYDQIELLDQLTRSYSGGMLGDLWSRTEILNEDYVRQKSGDEYVKYRCNIEKEKPNTFKSKLRRVVKSFFLNSLRQIWGNYNYDIWKEFKFRKSGEIHKWMYDRYSLKELLIDSGFVDVIKLDPFSSQINNWKTFQYLDVENNKIRKPDSLIMEAKKY